MFSWYRESSQLERKTFWACLAGWSLDALDVQLFSLAIPILITVLNISNGQAGFIGSATLITSALGGWFAGVYCDRYGCVKVLKLTVMWYALFTFLCAFSQTYYQLLFFKALQGFGFGGEWTAGAVLMSEIIRPAARGRAVGSVQSGWAIGWGLAVLCYTVTFLIMQPEFAWRTMFALGILPALLVIFIRRNLPIDTGKKYINALQANKVTDIFNRKIIRFTFAGTLLGIGSSGGYYSLMTWLPAYLNVERNFSVSLTGGYLAVIIIAYWLGCNVTAWMLDIIGRRRTVMLFAIACMIIVIIYLIMPFSNTQMLLLGFPLGFLSAGVPASQGALFSELFPTGIRGSGVGFCYNAGRVVSAAFPALVGSLSSLLGLGYAIVIYSTLAYLLVIIAIVMLPETRGRSFVDAGEIDK